jgi:hypothetical protein
MRRDPLCSRLLVLWCHFHSAIAFFTTILFCDHCIRDHSILSPQPFTKMGLKVLPVHKLSRGQGCQSLCLLDLVPNRILLSSLFLCCGVCRYA